MLFRHTYLLLLCLLPAATAYAQIDTTATDSLMQDSVQQELGQDMTGLAADTVTADSLKPVFKVYPWKYNTSLPSELVSTDSTLRWQVWPNWVYKKNRDPGVITYRMGTIGRTNALQIYSHEPRYQQLLWEGVSMNDPVSGTVNWDVIPLHKIRHFYEDNKGIRHQSNFFLKQYYLTQPLSQLIYKESKFDTRSLEFIVSQNFGPRTNAEISYWDRRDGGEYTNLEVGGRQVFARVFHQLDHRQALKVHFLNNNYTIGEPFGYGITDLFRFAFDHYQANPEQRNAESELAQSNLSINYYRRGADTTDVGASDFRAGLFFNSRERSLAYNIDSTYYKVQSIGVNTHKWLNLDILQLEGSLSNEWFFNRDRITSSISYGSWNLLRSSASATFHPVPLAEIGGGAEFQNRSDGRNSHSVNVNATARLGRHIELSGGMAQGTKMPTIQQLYWSSQQYQGNPDLMSEEVRNMYGQLTFRFQEELSVGVRGQVKEVKNGVMIEQDSMFTNIAPYNSASVSAFFDYNSDRLELTGSATYHQYGNFMGTTAEPLPMDGYERVWLKGGAYIKGYLFDRAAFVKAGMSGMISPFSYLADHYNPVLDYWQPASDDQYLPSFDRLDIDISARVRTIMITLRWENVLDDVSQLGYFETAQYPMGQRRFIFGIRALFRN